MSKSGAVMSKSGAVMSKSEYFGVSFLLAWLLLSGTALWAQDSASGPSAEEWRARGDAAKQAGEFVEAAEAYSIVLERYPDDVDLLLARGMVRWWADRPSSARVDLVRVLELDPANAEAMRVLEQVDEALEWRGSARLMWVEELEEERSLTRTTQPLQVYGVEKRWGDRWEVGASGSLDLSEKRYVNEPLDIDTLLQSKYFDNVLLKASWRGGSQRVYGHFGYSPSEGVPTSYGVAWSWRPSWKGFDFGTALRGGYDYFYHWSQVGRDYGGIDLSAKRGRFSAEVDYQRSLVREAEMFGRGPAVVDTLWMIGSNGQDHLLATLGMRVFQRTGLRVELGYEYSNYEYGTTLYYAPHFRQILSAGLAVEDRWGGLVYAAKFSGGSDDGGKEIDGTPVGGRGFWRGDLELGWDFGPVVTTVRGGLFSNPVYEASTLGVQVSF